MTFTTNSVRAQFPALNQLEDGRQPIFFDNPAGTQVPQAVLDAISDYYQRMNANAGGPFRTSQRSDAMMQTARQRLADFFNAPHPEEIVFGPNMTTLNFNLSRALGRTLMPGDEIILTRMDHDANIAPWLLLAEDHGAVIRWIDILTEDCTLDLNSYEEALNERTKIVATVHASNAVGTINPIQRIAAMAHAAGALLVVDAVQSAPHIPLDVQMLDCDFLLCSAYKFYGPHIGVLWGRYDLLETFPAYKVRPAKDVPPYRWETGTPSFETINGTRAAIDYLATLADPDIPVMGHYQGEKLVIKQALATIQQEERALVARLIEGLQTLPGVQIYGITDPGRYVERVPTVVFNLEGHTPQAIVEHLASEMIYAWAGHYYALEIMDRLGYSETGLVRIGLAHYNTHAEIDRLIEVLQALVKQT